jgi:hypothetical protein
MSKNKIVIGVLAVGLLISLGFLTYARFQNELWEEMVYGLAGYKGSMQALRDFRAGKLRVFVIAGENEKDRFSGTNDGPFEVWIPQYYPTFYPFRFSTEQEVAFYNRKMRYMHEHPAEFAATSNTAASVSSGR